MEYPNVPISQDAWNKMFKKSTTLKINPKQKYLDINTNNEKKKTTKRKTTQKNNKKSSNTKKKQTPHKKKSSLPKGTKKQRILKAPVNFL